jgi:hypothetical protein
MAAVQKTQTGGRKKRDQKKARVVLWRFGVDMGTYKM